MRRLILLGLLCCVPHVWASASELENEIKQMLAERGMPPLGASSEEMIAWAHKSAAEESADMREILNNCYASEDCNLSFTVGNTTDHSASHDSRPITPVSAHVYSTVGGLPVLSGYHNTPRICPTVIPFNATVHNSQGGFSTIEGSASYYPKLPSPSVSGYMTGYGWGYYFGD